MHDGLIKKLILTDLDSCGAYLMPENTIYQALGLRMARAPTKAEFDAALSALDAAGLVAGLPNPVTGERRWKITDAGKLALREL
jgi:hypothetical protein